MDAEKAALAAGQAAGPITQLGQDVITTLKLYVDKGTDFTKEVINRLTRHPELVEVEGCNGAIMHLMGDVEREAAPAAAGSAGVTTGGSRTAASSVGETATTAAGRACGTLEIESGGKFSASEIRSAEYMRDLGHNVVLRTPCGTRAGGRTSDLLVNGISYDVYTPTTRNHNRIITAIADKKDQAVGIVLDLSQTTATVEDLGDIMARLAGKGVTSIKDVVVIKK